MAPIPPPAKAWGSPWRSFMTTPAAIAVELFDELGQPATTTIAAITYWLVNNLYTLNTIIDEDYANANENTEIPDDQKDILKSLYTIRYYNLQIQLALGAAGVVGSSVTDILESSSDGFRVRFANRNEMLKIFNDLLKQKREELKDLINKYKMRNQTLGAVFGKDVQYPRIYPARPTDDNIRNYSESGN